MELIKCLLSDCNEILNECFIKGRHSQRDESVKPVEKIVLEFTGKI